MKKTIFDSLALIFGEVLVMLRSVKVQIQCVGYGHFTAGGAICGELRRNRGIRGYVVLCASKVLVVGLTIVMSTTKPVWGSAKHLLQVISQTLV